MRSEVAIDPLGRRVPLTGCCGCKHRLQHADSITGRTLLQGRHWTAVRQCVPGQWSNNTIHYQASRLQKVFNGCSGLRIECAINGESEVRGATQRSLPQWKCAGVTSPDQKLRACVSSVGKHGPPFNESRIEIHDVSDHVLAFKDFRSSDGEHGLNVQRNEWTPDSQFYVFNTPISGVHSPCHCQTYFYALPPNKFNDVYEFPVPITM